MTDTKMRRSRWRGLVSGVALLLAASASAAAETSAPPSSPGPALLSGHVYLDVGRDRKPAPNATITLYSKTSSAQANALNIIADDHGYYAIRQLQPATYAVFAALKGYNMGCAPNGDTIDFKGTPLVQDVDLIPDGIKLYCPAFSPAPSTS